MSFAGAAGEIGEALAGIRRESEEESMRLKFRAATAILRTIPSGTADADLTDEQRQAWRDHGEYLSWFESEHMGGEVGR